MTAALERSIKDRLTKLAKDQGKTFAEIWQTFFLERFLARLSVSPSKEKFIFKGGMLLNHYFPLGRQTMDLDFCIQKLASEGEVLKKAIEEIVAIDLKDGLLFSDIGVEPLIHTHMKYPGFQISMMTTLGRSRVKLFVDVGCGDPVKGVKKSIELLGSPGKPLFESSITLEVYPLEFIFAEKFETVMRRASLNSRMKDFFDLWNCIRSQQLDTKKLREAMKSTFEARETPFQIVIEFSEEELSGLQRLWDAFLRKIPDTRVPKDFVKVVRDLNSYLQDL